MANVKGLINTIYGQNDLGAHPFFKGGFINFGYWQTSRFSRKISLSDRIQASKNLYLQLLDKLELSDQDSVAEIGCGHGLGTVLSVSEYRVKKAVGVDLMPQQIERARERHRKFIASTKSLNFQAGSAEKTGLPSHQFSKIYTVEAAMHFPSMKNFLIETKRLLKPEGQVGICTFFPESRASLAQMKKAVPQLDLKLHPMLPIPELLATAYKLGYRLHHFERIGARVFPGFQHWVTESKTKESWGPIWHKAWKAKLMDYFTIIFELPRQ